MTIEKSFQDLGSVTNCFGCGADNSKGLQIKSFWDGEESVCVWKPDQKYCGGSKNILYGGTIASLIDCHSVNLAIANIYKEENRKIGSEPKIFCVSANLNISLKKPVDINKEVLLKAKIKSKEGRKTWVICKLSQDDNICAEGEVLAVRLKESY